MHCFIGKHIRSYRLNILSSKVHCMDFHVLLSELLNKMRRQVGKLGVCSPSITCLI